MRILFLINNLGGGGAERVLVNLVNHMDKSKYEITLISIFDNGINKKYLNSDIKYRGVFKRMPRGNTIIAKVIPSVLLYKFLIRDRYDIEISYLQGIATKVLAGNPNKNSKIIAWLHTDMKRTKILKKIYFSKNHILKSFLKYNKIVGVSKSVVDSFIEVTGIKNNVTVKYNTNDSDLILDKAKDLVSDWTIDKDEKNVYSIGRLVTEKGFDRLLVAHKVLIEKNIHHKLFIFGEGKERKRLQKYIDDNKLNDTVTLMGFKENPYKYISKCDLFVCSSRHEGLSTAMSEAIILGIPVITTKCSGAEEVVGAKSEYGLLVESTTIGIQKGLERFLTSKDLLDHYKIKSKERSSFFSIENTVREVENLIDEVMNNEL